MISIRTKHIGQLYKILFSEGDQQVYIRAKAGLKNDGIAALHLKTCELRYYRVNDEDDSEELLSGTIDGFPGAR